MSANQAPINLKDIKIIRKVDEQLTSRYYPRHNTLDFLFGGAGIDQNETIQEGNQVKKTKQQI